MKTNRTKIGDGMMLVSILCLIFFAAPASAEYASYSEVGQAIANNTFDPDLMPKPGPVIPDTHTIVNAFSSRANFDSAYPGAPLEDFEDTLLSDNVVLNFDGPLNSSTNNSAYAPGAIMDGISINAVINGGDGQLAVLTDGYMVGVPTTMVGANAFVDNTEITFSEDNVMAVAMDIFMPVAQGDIEITVYGPGGTVQDTDTLTVDADGEFFGIATDEPISRIVLSTPGGELIDNLSFALAPINMNIPTLSEWGVIIMTLFLVGAGALFIRRRQTANLL